MINNNDLEILRVLVMSDHVDENGTDIHECGHDNCWAKRIVKWIEATQKTSDTKSKHSDAYNKGIAAIKRLRDRNT